MIRPAPPAPLVVAAMAMLMPARDATAASIIAFQQPTMKKVDAQPVDQRCHIVDAPVRKTDLLGKTTWVGGRLEWKWDAGNEPMVVYVQCDDRARPQPPSDDIGGTLSPGFFYAPLPMPLSLQRSKPPGGVTLPGPAVTSDTDAAPTETINPPPIDEPVTEVPIVFDLPIEVPITITSDAVMPISPADGPLPIGDIDWPIQLDDPIDPVDLTPVPEPATLLLFGTGLAAARVGGRRWLSRREVE